MHLLSERQQFLLTRVIEGHLELGRPLGSRWLSEQSDISWSPSTIRYELALLKGESGAVYNIGRGAAVSIGNLLEQMLSRSSVPISVAEDPGRLRQVDVPLQICDAQRFRARTHWEARIPLGQTLGDILDDWRSRVTAA